ncbi:MAG: tetratricopeptide repeat protein [Planctomycetes bacterium]|nr:tetratricopeptide repeat protein [Planctomycetota bacterium]
MKPTFPLVVLAAALLAAGAAIGPAVLFAPSAAADESKQRPDVIVQTEAGQKKRKPGRIESADYDKVVFTAQGGKKTDLPAIDVDVDSIQWSDAPAGYEDGVRALAAGDGETARRSFNDALNEKGVKPDMRDWVIEFANAGLGRAWLLAGDADKAADAFGKARTANAKSMILDRILLGLAEAEAARGKGDAAARAADDLIAAAKSARRSTWELDANIVKAKIKLAAGDYAGAMTAFDDTVRFAENASLTEKTDAGKAQLKRAGLDAAVRRGWAMIKKGESTKSQADYEAAKSYLDSLVSKHPGDPSVAGAASNAAGVAKFASGDAKGALRQFMTTEVVHFRAREEVACSLWWQAECWKKLGNEQNRSDRLQDLKKSFPGSEWARKAQ